MKGIFCGCKARNNEEYRKVIKNRMKALIGLIIIGIITMAVGFGAESFIKTSINEHMLGVYSGVGVGLFVGGIILWIKNKLILNDDNKLKESRLSNTDERIQEIGNKSIRVAAFIMIIVMYVAALIGGLFYQILFQALILIIFAFIITYLIAFKYYSKKM
jgi:uncharacterized membrane protein